MQVYETKCDVHELSTPHTDWFFTENETHSLFFLLSENELGCGQTKLV